MASVTFGTYNGAETEKTVELFLFFYVSGYDHGDELMAEAAQTRLQVIKESRWYDPEKHKVHCPPIQDISEIIQIVANYISQYGGESKAFSREIGVFSHSGWDGPIGTVPTSVAPEPVYKQQMLMPGWEQIRFNWVPHNARFVIFGCNSANESNATKVFAKNLSDLANFRNADVWGQSTSSFPSFVPDYRVTSVARSMGMGWNVGKTYMVGGNAGRGRTAICTAGTADGTDTEHIRKEHDRANVMNCFKNGGKINSIHQGSFHDHRKNS
jgi:hypothetical protein